MSSPNPVLPADADLDAAIFRAEWKRRMLERLAEVGMELVEEVRARATARPDPWSGERTERRDDFAKDFAQASRAVRLTLALHTLVEQEILALRKGERPEPAPASEPGVAVPRPTDPPRAARARARAAVFAAVDHSVGDADHAFEILDRAEARLAERGDYEAFLKLPFRECVAAICADLGVNPHWSRWSDWEGFVDDNDDPGFDWTARWRTRPERERAREGRSVAPEPVAALE